MDLYLMADGARANPAKVATAADLARDEALRWFDELRDPLRRYLICAGACPADADEAVQESFLRLYRQLEKSGNLSNLRGWVFQVARNYLRDERKSARRQRSVPLDEAMEREGRMADPRGSPEHCMLGEERSRRLHAAIEKLPAEQRECMLLRASGLRYREIAIVLGINISSVGVLVRRAVARLSEELA
jgi:RNA polymerase sigma-70 factor (ECF subfamily)